MKRVYCDRCGARIEPRQEVKCLVVLGLHERQFDLCKNCRSEAIEVYRRFLEEAYKKGEI